MGPIAPPPSPIYATARGGVIFSCKGPWGANSPASVETVTFTFGLRVLVFVCFMLQGHVRLKLRSRRYAARNLDCVG